MCGVSLCQTKAVIKSIHAKAVLTVQKYFPSKLTIHAFVADYLAFGQFCRKHIFFHENCIFFKVNIVKIVL